MRDAGGLVAGGRPLGDRLDDPSLVYVHDGAAAGAAVFSLVGRPGWAAACGVVFVLASVDLMVIVHHIHQGPHYQPGPDIPPYEPPRGR